MALTWRRWFTRPERRQYQETGPIQYGQPSLPADDYILQTEMEASRTPVPQQLVRVLQALLIAAIALLSLAVFWMIGLIFGIL